MRCGRSPTRSRPHVRRKSYRLTLDRYRAGLTSYLDVLVNEERVLAERLNRVRLEGRSLALAVGTMRALGGGYHVES